MKYLGPWAHGTRTDAYGGAWRRCDACNFMNVPGRNPQGGRHQPPSTVEYIDTVTGNNFYVDNDASQGCSACGSPAWASGGRLGDLGHPTW